MKQLLKTKRVELLMSNHEDLGWLPTDWKPADIERVRMLYPANQYRVVRNK